MSDLAFDDLASAFSGLGGFSPMMMMNKSETSATRRLLQCTGFGCYENDVSSKFAPHVRGAPDLSPADFAARRAVIDQVQKWMDSMQGKPDLDGTLYKNEWVPILYMYEIAKNTSRRERDWGHLLFCDVTISRFLLVMTFPDTCDCGNLARHDYASLTKWHADRMMSLVTYLHTAWGWDPTPKWIRATYTTPAHDFRLSDQFLSSTKPPLTGSQSLLPIFHVTSEDFVPSLLPGELERIDNTCEQDRFCVEKRLAPDAFAAARTAVLGKKEDRPDVSEAFKKTNPRECANCHKVSKDKNFKMCSQCKLVYYCDAQCQRSHWQNHKIWCKSAAKEKSSTLD